MPKFRSELRNLRNRNRLDSNLDSLMDIVKVTKKFGIQMRAVEVISACFEYRNNWLCEANRDEFCCHLKPKISWQTTKIRHFFVRQAKKGKNFAVDHKIYGLFAPQAKKGRNFAVDHEI